MPARRYSRKKKSIPRRNYGRYNRYNKRRYYNKRRNAYPTRGRSNIPTGIPDEMNIKLKYATTLTLSGGLNDIGEYVFRGNSIYDPDYTSTGTQPTGMAQWENFYNYYVVNGSSINVKFLSRSNSGPTANSIVAIIPSLVDGLPGSVNPETISTYPNVRYTLSGTGDGAKSYSMLKNYMSTKKMFGEKYLDHDFKSIMVSNPADLWYWIVCAQTLDGTTGPSWGMLVTITYYVTLKERVFLQPS